MGLAQMQAAMARLYTDAALRERFWADLKSMSASFELSTADIRQLAALPRNQVRYFARSLVHKRANEVGKLLPLTHRVLNRQFMPTFQRYTETYVPSGIRKHRADALAFCSFLEHHTGAQSLPPIWAEVAGYEATWLRAADSSFRFAIRWFHFPIVLIVRLLAEKRDASRQNRQWTIAIWFRLSRRGRPRYYTLSVPGWLQKQAAPAAQP